MTMREILVLSCHEIAAMARQTPVGDGVWGDSKFVFDGSKREPDWLVIIDDPPEYCLVNQPKQRRMLIVTEPPEVKTYREGFTNQFGHLLGPYRPKGFHGNFIESHPALPWLFGKISLLEDGTLGPIGWKGLQNETKKTASLSVICSDKVITEQQFVRRLLVDKLVQEFGHEIDVYGRGLQPFHDKSDFLGRYLFNIVLENNEMPHFWTEKLSDVILAGSYPIYSGGKNLKEYFDTAGFVELDTSNLDFAVKSIRSIVTRGLTSKNLEAMKRNKQALLEQYNFFPHINQTISNLDSRSDPGHEPVTILQNDRFRTAFDFLRSQTNRIRRISRRVTLANENHYRDRKRL